MLTFLTSLRRRHVVAAPIRGERGMVSLQMAILAPVILAITFSAVQATLYYHATNVAASAAQVGVEAARTQTGSAGQGRQAAASYLNEVGGSLMKGATVTVTRGVDTVTVRVTAPAPKIVPGTPLKGIDTRVSGVVERTTTP